MGAFLATVLLLVAPLDSSSGAAPPTAEVSAMVSVCAADNSRDDCQPAVPPPAPEPPTPEATVREGDTFSTLAWAWGVDLAVAEAANLDRVPDPNWISPGQRLRMPGGHEPPAPPPPASSPTVPGPSGTSSGPQYRVQSTGNHFSFGYCTWYVANRRPVPWFGDAGQWGPNAAAMGFPEGKTPRPGAIMVTWEGPIGHVAFVESVNGDGSWVVTEMNYNAWNVVDTRTVRPGSVPLETFIY